MFAQNHIEGLRVLARRNELTGADWLRLIEARRSLLAPHLHEMTLEPISSLQFMLLRPLVAYWNTAGVSVESDLENCRDQRCVFPKKTYSKAASAYEYHYNPPGSTPASGKTEWTWALTRDNEWISIEARFRFAYGHQGSRKTVTLENIIIKKWGEDVFGLAEHVRKGLRDIWMGLGSAIMRWHEHRAALLNSSRKLSELVAFEHELYEIATR